MRVFTPADILLPRVEDMTKWSCIACDQFTSEPEYWREAERLVGNAPSTLRLMLPEAWLGLRDSAAETRKIYAAMSDYVNRGLFETVENSYIYVERTLPLGAVRRGLVGKLDLECYDWALGSTTPVRATEGTVESRLPARVAVRRGASLEMPHIMVFLDDPENALIPSAAGGELLYDFELMQGGGRIRGSRVSGETAERLCAALDTPEGAVRFAMGDGNHSLAAAKRCWEQIKPTLNETERGTHPARYALAELVNIHDEAVTFEPIHRVLLDTDPRGFLEEAAARLPRGAGQSVTILAGKREMTIDTGLPLGKLVALADELLTDWAREHGGLPDYIHGDGEARALGQTAASLGLLLPRLEKSELFPYITEHGPYPKKSFSIGHARDKRYYLECRSID